MNYNENEKQRTSDATAPRRQPCDKAPADRLLASLPFIVALPISLIYLEIIVHLATFSEMNATFFAYVTLFNIASGMVIALLCTVFNKKVNFIITLVILGAVTLLSAIQVVYSAFFGDFFRLTAFGMAGNIADYMDNTVKAVFANTHWLLLLFLPFILFAVFGRGAIAPERANWMLRVACAVFAVGFFMLGTLYVNAHDDEFGDKYIYGEGFHIKESMNRFGFITTARLELQQYLFGDLTDEVPEDTVVIDNTTTAPDWNDIFGTDSPSTNPSVTNPPVTTPNTGSDSGSVTDEGTADSSSDETTAPLPPVIDTSPNYLDIDFEALKAEALANGDNALYNAHVYFQNRAGTNKHEYTGMFEGKNLIFITVEGWAPAAINQKLTPTLYMMKNEGFVFENYYCSLWGGSTATGEYANITGNFFYLAECIEASANTTQRFTLGNMLKEEGYICHGFHNHAYDYYDRDIAHPNFGYDWHGVGNWDVEFTSAWPKSDHELALNSLSYITADKPFHLYYMTVSGHAYQTFGGNRQAAKHRSYVTSIIGNDYKNQTALSFISCQYEVELMVKALYDECARLGILEDTVFVLAPDHFPYSLSEKGDAANAEALAELYNIPADGIYQNFDLYRAPLIIWSGSMEEPIKVEKVCSAIDILPTLLNLFGLEYDSRLITGQDILSTAPGFVPLNTYKTSYNWITDYGSYNYSTGKFTLAEGVTVDKDKLDSYISYYKSYNKDIIKYSPYILANASYGKITKINDYYSKVFP